MRSWVVGELELPRGPSSYVVARFVSSGRRELDACIEEAIADAKSSCAGERETMRLPAAFELGAAPAAE